MFCKAFNRYNYLMGGYPDSNRELTVPHTVALPLNYNHLFCFKKQYNLFFYVGVIRTPNNKYQKFMTYLLVHNIYTYKLIIVILLYIVKIYYKVNPT